MRALEIAENYPDKNNLAIAEILKRLPDIFKRQKNIFKQKSVQNMRLEPKNITKKRSF